MPIWPFTCSVNCVHRHKPYSQCLNLVQNHTQSVLLRALLQVTCAMLQVSNVKPASLPGISFEQEEVEADPRTTFLPGVSSANGASRRRVLQQGVDSAPLTKQFNLLFGREAVGLSGVQHPCVSFFLHSSWNASRP